MKYRESVRKGNDANLFPVSVSELAIQGSPEVFICDVPLGQLWQARWRLDRLRRQLVLACAIAEPGRYVTQLGGTDDMLAGMFGAIDRDRVKPEVHATGDCWMWNGEVEWTLASTLAPIEPDALDPATYRNGRCRVGPDRRYCIAFIWKDERQHAALAGAYCEDVPKGSEFDAIGALSRLHFSLKARVGSAH